jgi:DNA mismatch repair ATPase MutS
MKHTNIKEQCHKMKGIIDVINKYNMRIDNHWQQFDDCGEEFIKEGVLTDLDIVGKNSLFQYLNVAVSDEGRKKLFQSLYEPKFNEQILLKRQDAVKELSEQLEFCIQYQQIMNSGFNKNMYKQISLMKDSSYSKIILILNSLLSLITLLLGLLSLFNILPYQLFIMSAVLNFSISLLEQFIYKDNFDRITKSIKGFHILYQAYDCVLQYDFNSDMMIEIKNHIQLGHNAIKHIYKIYNLDTFRYNFLGYIIVNALFPLNSFILYLFSLLKVDDLYDSLSYEEDLEALMSLSVLGVCKKDVCIPQLNQTLDIEVKDIKHPLLNEECISNDFKCSDNIIMITGSNMSGKTSFMRTIGMNLVLMYAGSFVCAKQMHAPFLKILTSMRVKDDIDQGISTFYGELLRMKEMIDYSESHQPLVCFVDEIFKGTNYNDRIFGAKAIIDRLNKDNVILFISTHDFELCDLDNDKLVNYYFEEHYVDNEIMFDYKIKKGKCKTTNARYLMNKLGIIK